ncbi:MAG: serine/threonine protein kinase [Gammaproteobacteria bacterium]|jgi:serine/threonine protein kinase
MSQFPGDVDPSEEQGADSGLDATYRLERTLAEGGDVREETAPDEEAPQSDDEMPDIPSIEMRREIGRGAMGVVYEARQTFLDRDVAVKILIGACQTSEFARRFQREAKLLALLSHPNVVSCFQAGSLDNGQCYLVMEYIRGPNLEDYIKEKGALSVEAALRICRDLARALGYAKGKGMIHRDVKPANVLLQPLKQGVTEEYPYQTKLADLGLARPEQVESTDLGLTVPGSVLGSPASMAPEQFSDPDNVDHRADIYGVGYILFQVLAGKPPFPVKSLGELVTLKMQETSPDLLSAAGRDLPSEVVQLVDDMLSRQRDDRPQTYGDIERRCEELLNPNAYKGVAVKQGLPLLPVLAVGLAALLLVAWMVITGGDQGSNWMQSLHDSVRRDGGELRRVGDSYDFDVITHVPLTLSVLNAKGEPMKFGVNDQDGVLTWEFEHRTLASEEPLQVSVVMVASPNAEILFSETLSLHAVDDDEIEDTVVLDTFEILHVELVLNDHGESLLALSDDPSALPSWEVWELQNEWANWSSIMRADYRLGEEDWAQLEERPEVAAWIAALEARVAALLTPVVEVSLLPSDASEAFMLTDPSGGWLLYSAGREQSVELRVTGAQSKEVQLYFAAKRVTLALDFGEGASATSIGTASYPLVIPPGETSLALNITDEQGKLNGSLEMTLDDAVPVLQGSLPDRMRTQGETLHLEVVAQDAGSGVRAVTWQLTGDHSAVPQPLVLEGNDWVGDLPLNLGANEFSIRATDNVGLVSEPAQFLYRRAYSGPLLGIDPNISYLVGDGVTEGLSYEPEGIPSPFVRISELGGEWRYQGTGIGEEELEYRLSIRSETARFSAVETKASAEAGDIYRLAASRPLAFEDQWKVQGIFGFRDGQEWPMPINGESSFGRIALGSTDGSMIVLELKFNGQGTQRTLERSAYLWDADTMWRGIQPLVDLGIPAVNIPADEPKSLADAGVEFSISLGADSVTVAWGVRDSDAERTSMILKRSDLTGWEEGGDGHLLLQGQSGYLVFEQFDLMSN